jgi:hypothetical protein
LFSAHYTAIVWRSGEGEWFLYDDDSPVERVPVKAVLEEADESGYFLAYELDA